MPCQRQQPNLADDKREAAGLGGAAKHSLDLGRRSVVCAQEGRGAAADARCDEGGGGGALVGREDNQGPVSRISAHRISLMSATR